MLWPQTSQYILILLMFCGACAGSTGGGVKCSRMLILLRTIRREIHQIAHPRSVEVVRLEGKVVDENTLRSVLTFIGCYVLILLGAGLIVSLDDVSFSVSFSAALTCLSNVGPVWCCSAAGPGAAADPAHLRAPPQIQRRGAFLVCLMRQNDGRYTSCFCSDVVK